jgi:hypothetical protein
MRLRLSIFFVFLLSGPFLWAQIKKQFAVEDVKSSDLVKITMKTNTGHCYIRPGQSNEVFSVYSNQDLETYSHRFSKELIGKTLDLHLNFEESRSQGLSQTISSRVLGSRPSENLNETFWRIYLNESKPYHLDLSYGMGNANIDLSGVAVRILKISSGSANVHLGYLSEIPNKVVMDSLLVKVEMGSIHVKRLNLSRSNYVFAEVGFGNMMLDFSDAPDSNKTIKGRVGAGNLTIILPPEEIPVQIKITDSWLCKVNMLHGYTRVGNNTYVNSAYSKDAVNLMSFDLDVSMGNITFTEKSRN